MGFYFQQLAAISHKVQINFSFMNGCQSDLCFTHPVECFIAFFLINDFLFIIACVNEHNSCPGCCPVFSRGRPRVYFQHFQF
jgi:hypothetical protein